MFYSSNFPGLTFSTAFKISFQISGEFAKLKSFFARMLKDSLLPLSPDKREIKVFAVYNDKVVP